MATNKDKHSLRLRIAPLIIASVLCAKCASDQGGQQQGEAVNGTQQGQSQTGDDGNGANLAQGESMNNAVEGGSSENFASGETNNAGLTNNAAVGESLNNVPIENPAGLTANTPANIPLNQTAPLNTAIPLNQGNTMAGPLNAAQPTNGLAAPQNQAIQAPQQSAAPTTGAVTTDANSAQRAAASPFQNPHMNWPGKGKVKYVKRQITRHATPNGPVVGEFEQGEHPLVYQNGNWVELNDGSFVKGNGLSEQPIGYNKGKQTWQ